MKSSAWQKGLAGAMLATATLAFWVAAACAADRSPQADKPVEPGLALPQTVVTSDEVSYDYEKGVAVFERNVHVDDLRIRLWSDRMTIVMEGTNQVRSLVAEGSVHFAQNEGRGSCRRAEYHAAADKILLTGDALLIQGADELRADVIEFVFAENVIRNVRASGRVRMTRAGDGPSGGLPSLLPGLTRDRKP